jgi:adenine deaminase
VVTDPHEIANVVGAAGIRFLLENSESIGLEVFFMAPSCVPATPLETTGAELDVESLAWLAEQPGSWDWGK